MLEEVEEESWFVVLSRGQEAESQLVTQFGVHVEANENRIFKTYRHVTLHHEITIPDPQTV